MHPNMRAALLAGLVAALPAASFAADVTPEQAGKLEGQLRDWFQGVAGPDLQVAVSPVQVMPEGDHFRLTLPSPAIKMPVQGWPAVTANARPADAGRWALDSIRMQSPATFTINTPAPSKPDDRAARPGGPAARPGSPSARPGAQAAKPAAALPTRYTISYEQQDGGGTWDPSFATPSVINSKSSGFQLTAENSVSKQVTKLQDTASTTTLSPAAADRVNMGVDVTGQGYSLNTAITDPAAGGGPASVEASARQVKLGMILAGVSRDRAARLVPAMVKMNPTPAGGTYDAKVPPNPDGVRMLIEALQGFASAMTLTEVLDDFKLSTSGFSASMAQARFGLDAKTDGEFLDGSMDVGLDGLALPGMGLDAFDDLLPSRVALRPVVSHVPSKELLQLLQAAMLKGDGPMPPDATAALFSRGGLKAGLESFALEMGGASFAGTASVDIPAPNQATGKAQVTAANLDALMAKVQANPALAQAVPVLALVKGIGRAEGNRVAWDLTFDGARFLVNGVDLAKMGGR